MDNLQQHYLRLLQGAQKKALAGEFQECLDICFDLRLKPDLALYTRAMVCLTICNFAHYRDLPQKVAIAKDALRIAKELMEDQSSPKDTFWTKNYDDLIQDAEKAVEQAEEEEKEQEAITFTTEDFEDNRGDEVRWIEEKIPARENDTPVIGMPKIEGAFTNRPATMGATTSVDLSQGSGSSAAVTGDVLEGGSK